MDLAGLQRLLGEPEIAWLVERIRGRLERGEPVDGTVTLVGATHAERRAATRLLGHGVGRGTSLSVPLPEVAAALRRAGAAPSLPGRGGGADRARSATWPPSGPGRSSAGRTC